MIGSIFYAVGTFVVGFILTTIFVALRPLKTTAERKTWPILLLMMVLAGGTPFAFVEYNTKEYGPAMKAAVKGEWNFVDIDADLDYFKVLYIKNNRAKVLVAGTEEAAWGRDRCFAHVDLIKVNGKWESEDHAVINSLRVNQDQIVFPPYY